MQTEGKPVGQQFGYVFDGYFTEEEAANYENLKGNIEGGIPDQGSGYVPLAGDVRYRLSEISSLYSWYEFRRLLERI